MVDLEKLAHSLGGKPVLVFGLGVSGLSLVKALVKAGVGVVAGDDNPQSLQAMEGLGIEILDLSAEHEFSRFAFVILSPGVPLTHPQPHAVVVAARQAGVEIIGDIELFHRYAPRCRTIGVTGTNGKSTTVSLIYHILKACGIKADLGGNIGRPVFDLNIRSKNYVAVLELSSFQIDLCPTFRPDISVILNLSPDHIDRHGTMENYAEVKGCVCEISRDMKDKGTVVIASDDEYCQKILDRARGYNLRDVIEVSTVQKPQGGVYIQDNILFDHTDAVLLEVGNMQEISSLKGVHNHQNAACAYAAARACGLAPEEIFAAMKTFPGLQHRQFLVRTMNGVAYVNDSKATNAAATAMALGCHNNIYWIVGGRKKKTGLQGLEGFFTHIKHAFLIGESADDFSTWFDQYGIEYTKSITLQAAVSQAHYMAQENRGQPGGAGVVLLSPACASFDQFKSFEDRGNVFIKLVEELEEAVQG